jgi:hypothetical protein
MDWNIIFAALTGTVAAILSPLIVVALYYGIGYNVLERFADPAFEVKIPRLIELFFSFFIFATICGLNIGVLDHFHVPHSEKLRPFTVLIPILIYLVIRCIARFHSPRIARDHLNILVFIALVSTVINMLYYNIIDRNDSYHLPNMAFFIEVAILSIIVPTISEYLLFILPKNRFVRKFVMKENKLIDITDELPIKISFIVSQTNIDKKIKELISESSENVLRILTKSYTTISKNKDLIKERCKRSTVKIIGDNNLSDSDVAIRVAQLETEGLTICRSNYENIKMIIDGDKRVIATYPTSGTKGSHVGIYSDHPFIISLFKSYFDIKCSQNNCEMQSCKKKDL